GLVQLRVDIHRSAFSNFAWGPPETVLGEFQRWLDAICIVRPNPWLIMSVAERPERHPSTTLSNLGEWLRYQIEQRGIAATKAFLDDLGEVIPGLSDLRLIDLGEGRRALEWGFKLGPAKRFGQVQFNERMGALSEGQRVLVGLYAILHFGISPGSLLCFDEPDNFIALREVQPWLRQVLKKTEDAATGCQVLLVSHHPEILNWMAGEDGLLFDRPDGRETRVRSYRDAIHTELTPAELVARGWENE
ncbi:MAG: AAA family ATPase, partial [bacterium]